MDDTSISSAEMRPVRRRRYEGDYLMRKITGRILSAVLSASMMASLFSAGSMTAYAEESTSAAQAESSAGSAADTAGGETVSSAGQVDSTGTDATGGASGETGSADGSGSGTSTGTADGSGSGAAGASGETGSVDGNGTATSEGTKDSAATGDTKDTSAAGGTSDGTEATAGIYALNAAEGGSVAAETSAATETDGADTEPLEISGDIGLDISGYEYARDNEPITLAAIKSSSSTKNGDEFTDSESNLNGFKAVWASSSDGTEAGAVQITFNAYVSNEGGVFADPGEYDEDEENTDDGSDSEEEESSDDGSDSDDEAYQEYLERCSRQYNRFMVHWTVEEVGRTASGSSAVFKSGTETGVTANNETDDYSGPSYEIKASNDLVIDSTETCSEIHVRAELYADGELYHDYDGNAAMDEFAIKILRPYGYGTTAVKSFTITPDQEKVKPGGTQQFTVHAVTEDGESIGSIKADDPITFSWDVSATKLGDDSIVLKEGLKQEEITLPVDAQALSKYTGTTIDALEDSANGSIGVLNIGKKEDDAELTVTATAKIPKDSGYSFPDQKEDGDYYIATATATVLVCDTAEKVTLSDDRGDSAEQGKSFTVYYCDQSAVDSGAEEETVYTTGKPITFNADVTGFGPSYRSVEWKLEGNADSETVLTENADNNGQAVLTIGAEEAQKNKNHRITVTVTAVSPDAKGKVLSATAIVNLGDYIDMRFENADSHERISANIVKSISVGGIYHVRAMVRTGSGSNGYAFDPNVTWTVAYADRGGKPAGADGKTAETAQSLVAADDLDSLKNAAKTGGTESAYVVGSDHSLYLYISPSDKDFQRIRVTALSTEYKSGAEPAQAHFDVVRSVRGTIRVDTDKQKNISSLTLSCGDEVSFYGFLNSEEDDNLDWDLTGAKSDDTYILAEGDEGKPLSVRGAEKTTLHIGTDESASSLTVRVKDPYYSTVKTLNIRISHYTRAYIVNESSRAFTGNTTSLSRNGRVVLKAKLDSLVDDPKNTNALSPDNKNNLDGKISWTISGNTDPGTKIVTGEEDENGETASGESGTGMPGTVTLVIGAKEKADQFTVTLSCVKDPLTKPAVLTVSMNYSDDIVILDGSKKCFSDHSDESNTASSSIRTGESMKLYAGVNDSLHPKTKYRNGCISADVKWAVEGFDENNNEIVSMSSSVSDPAKDGSVTLYADPSDRADHYVVTVSISDTSKASDEDVAEDSGGSGAAAVYTLTVKVQHADTVEINQNTNRKAVYRNNALTVKAGQNYAFRPYLTYADEKRTSRVADSSEVTWSLVETEDGAALPGADYSKHQIGGETIQDTYIDENGVLHVAADEQSARIYVRAETKDARNAESAGASTVLIVNGPARYKEISGVLVQPSQRVVDLSAGETVDIPLKLNPSFTLQGGTFALTSDQLKAAWSFERYDSRNRKIKVTDKNENPDIVTGFVASSSATDEAGTGTEDAKTTVVKTVEGSDVTFRVDPKEIVAADKGCYQTDHIVVTAVWTSANNSKTARKATSVIYLGGARGTIAAVNVGGQTTAIRGSSIQLTATVKPMKAGTYVNSDVTWQIQGRDTGDSTASGSSASESSEGSGSSSGTFIDENGRLTVGEGEKATRLTVTATAKDPNPDGTYVQGKMTVSVRDRSVASVFVRSLPVKTEFAEGQTLTPKDFYGLIIKVRYDDGTVKLLGYDEENGKYDTSEFSQDSFSYSSRRGTQNVTYTYHGKKTSFKVSFRAKILKSIELFDPRSRIGTKETDKTYYTGKTDKAGGTKLDLTGVYLLAYYDNGKAEKVPVSSGMISPSVRAFTTADLNPKSKDYTKDETTGVISDVKSYTVTYVSGNRRATVQFRVKLENNPVVRAEFVKNPDLVFQYANAAAGTVSAGDTTLENAYGLVLTGAQIFRKMQLRVDLVYNDGSVLKNQSFSVANWNVGAVITDGTDTESEVCSVTHGASPDKDSYAFAVTAGASGVFALPVQYRNKGYAGVSTDGNNSLVVLCPIRLAARTIAADYGDTAQNSRNQYTITQYYGIGSGVDSTAADAPEGSDTYSKIFDQSVLDIGIVDALDDVISGSANDNEEQLFASLKKVKVHAKGDSVSRSVYDLMKEGCVDWSSRPFDIRKPGTYTAKVTYMNTTASFRFIVQAAKAFHVYEEPDTKAKYAVSYIQYEPFRYAGNAIIVYRTAGWGVTPASGSSSTVNAACSLAISAANGFGYKGFNTAKTGEQTGYEYLSTTKVPKDRDYIDEKEEYSISVTGAEGIASYGGTGTDGNSAYQLFYNNESTAFLQKGTASNVQVIVSKDGSSESSDNAELSSSVFTKWRRLYFVSDDPSVVSVDPRNGRITARSVGTATIRMYAPDASTPEDYLLPNTGNTKTLADYYDKYKDKLAETDCTVAVYSFSKIMMPAAGTAVSTDAAGKKESGQVIVSGSTATLLVPPEWGAAGADPQDPAGTMNLTDKSAVESELPSANRRTVVFCLDSVFPDGSSASADEISTDMEKLSDRLSAESEADAKTWTPSVKISNTGVVSLADKGKDENACGITVSGNEILVQLEPEKIGNTRMTLNFGGKTATLNLQVRAALDPDWFSLEMHKYIFTGNVIRAKVNTKATGLPSNLRYRTAYVGGLTDYGTYRLEITGQGNYAGTIAKYYRINTVDLNKTKVVMKSISAPFRYSYNTKTGGIDYQTHLPSFTVQYNGRTLRNMYDYFSWNRPSKYDYMPNVSMINPETNEEVKGGDTIRLPYIDRYTLKTTEVEAFVIGDDQVEKDENGYIIVGELTGLRKAETGKYAGKYIIGLGYLNYNFVPSTSYSFHFPGTYKIRIVPAGSINYSGDQELDQNGKEMYFTVY